MGANSEQVAGTHYTKQAIQVWDYITANNIPYLEGNAIKYLSRWREKGGVQDLYKARHYIDKLIELEEQATVEQAAALEKRGADCWARKLAENRLWKWQYVRTEPNGIVHFERMINDSRKLTVSVDPTCDPYAMMRDADEAELAANLPPIPPAPPSDLEVEHESCRYWERRLADVGMSVWRYQGRTSTGTRVFRRMTDGKVVEVSPSGTDYVVEYLRGVMA